MSKPGICVCITNICQKDFQLKWLWSFIQPIWPTGWWFEVSWWQLEMSESSGCFLPVSVQLIVTQHGLDPCLFPERCSASLALRFLCQGILRGAPLVPDDRFMQRFLHHVIPTNAPFRFGDWAGWRGKLIIPACPHRHWWVCGEAMWRAEIISLVYTWL